MNTLSGIVAVIDKYFNTDRFDVDPTFGKYLPIVYDSIGFDWQHFFEKKFTKRCDGLMIRGCNDVSDIYCATFLSDFVLETFLRLAKRGSLLFTHHPIDMECGNPMGAWGKGFIAPDPKLLLEARMMNHSIYSCHTPLDIHETISTNQAICQALGGEIVDHIMEAKYGYGGMISMISETNTYGLIGKLVEIFGIPYVDFEGRRNCSITKVAIVAGGGDRVKYMEEAEQKGAEAYITGEVHHHIDTDYGRMRYTEMLNYAKETKMSLVGVSHAASEFLVLRTQLSTWLRNTFHLDVYPIDESVWSASRRLSFWFSASSFFSLLTSLTLMPPYLERQL